jgi:hypothetical protein
MENDLFSCHVSTGYFGEVVDPGNALWGFASGVAYFNCL